MFKKKLRGTQKRHWFYNAELPKGNLEHLSEKHSS